MSYHSTEQQRTISQRIGQRSSGGLLDLIIEQLDPEGRDPQRLFARISQQEGTSLGFDLVRLTAHYRVLYEGYIEQVCWYGILAHRSGVA